MLVEVRVTEQDIEAGRKQDCRRCPIALALERALGREVSVLSNNFRIVGVAVFFALPGVAKQFIWDFDNANDVGPITFIVEVP